MAHTLETQCNPNLHSETQSVGNPGEPPQPEEDDQPNRVAGTATVLELEGKGRENDDGVEHLGLGLEEVDGGDVKLAGEFHDENGEDEQGADVQSLFNLVGEGGKVSQGLAAATPQKKRLHREGRHYGSTGDRHARSLRHHTSRTPPTPAECGSDRR